MTDVPPQGETSAPGAAKSGGCGCGTVFGVLLGIVLVAWGISLFQGGDDDPCEEASGIRVQWEQAVAAGDEDRIGQLASKYRVVQQECLAQ